MKEKFYIGRYHNNAKELNALLIKWACINPKIKEGSFLCGRWFLLNEDRINKCIFYPIKRNITIDSCSFITTGEELTGKDRDRFDLMLKNNELSVEIYH